MITEELQLAIDRRKRTLVALLDNPHPSQVDALFETIDLLIQARVREGVKFAVAMIVEHAGNYSWPDDAMQRGMAQFDLLKQQGKL